MATVALLRKAAALAALGLGLYFFNDNTSLGDHWRHRPYWLLALNELAPSFDLDPSWFLKGNETPLIKEGLYELVHSLNHEANLTGMGKVFAYWVAHDSLQQYDCVTRILESAPKNPFKTDTPPLIVVGLPRTGTTFMHGLLSQDQAFRAPRFHEYMSACPKPTKPDNRSVLDSIRVWFQGFKMVGIRLLLPKLSAMHHIDDLTPEEDIVPLGQTMASALFPTAFYLPSYTKWLMNNKPALTSSAAYLKRYLDEHLRFDDRPWVLKTPWHLALLGDLHTHFPDAHIVWMHRSPAKAMSSTSSLVLSLVGMNSDLPKSPEFVSAAANETAEFWRWTLEQGVNARRSKYRPEQFFDVNFDEFAADPIAMIREIYKHFNLPLSLELEEDMRAYSKINARGKRFGYHDYNDSLLFRNLNEVNDEFYKVSRLININHSQN